MRWLLAALLVGALSMDVVTAPASGQTTSGSSGSSTGPTYPPSTPQIARPAPPAPASAADGPSISQAPLPESPLATDPNPGPAPGGALR